MATARGLPTPRPMLTTATLAFTATARGLLRGRPMPTTATLVSATVTVWAMATGSVRLGLLGLLLGLLLLEGLLLELPFKGGAASTEIKKKYKKVQFQVSKFSIKNVISSQNR